MAVLVMSFGDFADVYSLSSIKHLLSIYYMPRNGGLGKSKVNNHGAYLQGVSM